MAFSVIVKTDCETNGSFYSTTVGGDMDLTSTVSQPAPAAEAAATRASYRGHDYQHPPSGGSVYSEQPPQSPEGRRLTMASVESPVLGESVSMYQVTIMMMMIMIVIMI